ncbi:MAG: GntR family transcriptional regulator [Clostridia bacterium]|nr:GntR family transcriptional regulator [Clostridia bacterium]
MAIIKKTSLKHQTYDIIKKKILSQSYKLGEKINIDSLARELNISNSPIREALNMLEKDGFVITNPNTGIRVVDLTPNEILELNQTIQILLIGGYDLCVAQGKVDRLISRMREHLSQQNHFQKEKDSYNLIKSSINFDGCFLTVTDNKRLISLYNNLSDVLFLAIIHYQQTNDASSTKNIHEHQMILDAVVSNQHDEVKRLIAIHYDKL